MTKKETIEFDGFMKAKRQITKLIDGRIEQLEQRRGDLRFTLERNREVIILEVLRDRIRNVVLYEVKSKTSK